MSRRLFLSLDTATDQPTVALGSPEQPGANVTALHRRDLSRDIEKIVLGLFAQRGVRPRDLAGIVVADGPGSFTGLRIGIAFAKGMASVLGVPLLAAPSMMGAARTSLSPLTSGPLRPLASGLVVVDYDALRGDVYRAAYRFGDRVVEVIEAPAVVRADAATIEGSVRASAKDASAASLLAMIGMPGGPVAIEHPASWEPDYGRPAEAEARLLARHGRIG